MDSRMHFTFSDTIAGSVVAYQADEDTFTLRTIDGREFEVAITNQTYAEVTRNLGEAYIDATGQMREMLDRGRILFAYGVFYPEGGTTVFEAKRIVFVGRKAQDFVFERPEWWVQQVREIADFYRNAQWPDGEIDFSVYRTQISLEGDKLPGHEAGDRHDLAARLRLRDGVPADRRGPLPRGRGDGHRVPARPHAHGRRGRGDRVLGARRRHRRRQGEEDPRLRVRRRLRRDPGLRADLRARRAHPDVPRHRRPADPERHRADARALQPLLPRPRRRGLLLAHRPDHVRPAQRVARRATRRARTGTRSATTRRRF